ncbi:regulatory-associated protein of mTOR-like isoform X2 [Artemia franciscana]|uniref:regulatory-associated protein of mTOR-like isoform X1 n=1 Tax=Artemia franciscana TaxID=6661 RepID=UPI0032DB9630
MADRLSLAEVNRKLNIGAIEDLDDWAIPIAFIKNENMPNQVNQRPNEDSLQPWRLKERMKTVSVALVLCLNVGVDPPDVIKPHPCARLECWIDPLSMSPQKALEGIGGNLQKQYERWQPRARYKQSLDPTVEDIKKLAVSLRRNAKDERVLFHYNGHGVPRPTVNGEIWVFNKTYTQYIPLSVYDLQSWMWSPSIYVFDCSNAGMIVDSFRQFAEQHEKEYEQLMAQSRGTLPAQMTPAPNFKNCIQLAACGGNQILPMNSELPADLFTSCLTTPIKTALKWYVLQNSRHLVPKITLDLIDKIPGQLSDRRTMLGELNWIFTAITDTVAWNSLPQDVFQRLFRQDLLVASLFRNFLLAERIMRCYDCTPVSSPKLPPTHQHSMWQAWDLALDVCLSQLPAILKGETIYEHSPFFEEQLTAFEVWLSHGSQSKKPEQLPILLQVLLSQVHRLRALQLLGKFLDLGPWAVNLALSVGIFPYVLKLLQSSVKELRPMLIFIWAKILAVDLTHQADLVRDGGHKYFLAALQDPTVPSDQRSLVAFVLARIVWNYSQGQEAALTGSLVSITLEQLQDSDPLLRQWAVIALGKSWENFESARWVGVRDSAHEKLFDLLLDPVPEVRAAALFAIGTFISSVSTRTDHANNIDHGVALKILGTVSQDANVVVRKELVAAFQWVVFAFESSFIQIVCQQIQEEEAAVSLSSLTIDSSSITPMKRSQIRDRVLSTATLGTSPDRLRLLSNGTEFRIPELQLTSSTSLQNLRRTASAHSLNSPSGYLANLQMPFTLSSSGIYHRLWAGLSNLEKDPHPEISNSVRTLCTYIRAKARDQMVSRDVIDASIVRSSSPVLRNPKSGDQVQMERLSPELKGTLVNSKKRKTSVSTLIAEEARPVSISSSEDPNLARPTLETDFIKESCNHFNQPLLEMIDEDKDSMEHYIRDWKFFKNCKIRTGIYEEVRKLSTSRLEEQIFLQKNPYQPTALRFHPYYPWLAVADKSGCSFWDFDTNMRFAYISNQRDARITAADFVNAHDNTLIMLGSDDGSVKIWKENRIINGSFGNESLDKPLLSETTGTSLVTAWQCLPELVPSTRGKYSIHCVYLFQTNH